VFNGRSEPGRLSDTSLKKVSFEKPGAKTPGFFMIGAAMQSDWPGFTLLFRR
jgi:hypothetical protein